MKLVKLDPPGTWCHNQALAELIATRGARRFVEVGCGAGDLSRSLCERGLDGTGIDFSAAAVAQARENLASFIEQERYRLLESDLAEVALSDLDADLAVSMMVMEHVEDDVGFLRSIAGLVQPGGNIIVGVPGRRDRWCLEDETVGHLRRYDRDDLIGVLRSAGLQDVEVWSVAVPVANILFNLSNALIGRSSEVDKRELSLREQTETSGIREIPFKTVFPSWCRILLNRYTMFPFFLVQRLFYRTNLGITMLGVGRVPD